MAATETDAIGRAFAEAPGRAALMPYLMGGFPTIEGSKEVGYAYADGGADLVELGVPFSDPLAGRAGHGDRVEEAAGLLVAHRDVGLSLIHI